MKILSGSSSKNADKIARNRKLEKKMEKKRKFDKLVEQKCNNQAIKKLKKGFKDESEVEDVLMKYYDACVDSAIHSD